MKELRVGDLVAWMEALAPAGLAEEWDNVGLQCGDVSRPVERVMTALTVSAGVVDQALAWGAQMIVAHHPLIFRPLSHLRPDTRVGSLLYKLIKADVALLVAHTNLDAAPGGVNDTLAHRLGLCNCAPLVPAAPRGGRLKLVTFVPEEALEAVREALAAAGAGVIGLYTHCTFAAPGQGSFKPAAGADPYVGSVGALTLVPEHRLETLLDERDVERVVRALRAAHPYEEVPIDLYPLRAEGAPAGIGRVGELPEALAVEEFVRHVENSLNLTRCRVAGKRAGTVRRVAVVGGSGGKFAARAHTAGADALVTGDVDYHDADEAEALGLLVVDAGHFGTEKHVAEEMARYLARRAAESGAALAVRAAAEEDAFRFPG